MTNTLPTITRKNVNGAIIFSDDRGGQVAAVVRDVFGEYRGSVGYHPSVIGMVLREVEPTNTDKLVKGGIAIQLGTKNDTFARRGEKEPLHITQPEKSLFHDFRVSDLSCKEGDNKIAGKSVHGDVGVAIAATRIREFEAKHPELVATVRQVFPEPIAKFGGRQVSLNEMLNTAPMGRDGCTESLLKADRVVNAKGGK